MTVNANTIVLALKDGQSLTISPKQVTALGYSLGLGLKVIRFGPFFAVRKTALHCIGIAYMDKEGKIQSLSLQGDTSNFRAIIVALQTVTGVLLSGLERERDEIPPGIAVQTGSNPNQPRRLSN